MSQSPPRGPKPASPRPAAHAAADTSYRRTTDRARAQGRAPAVAWPGWTDEWIYTADADATAIGGES